MNLIKTNTCSDICVIGNKSAIHVKKKKEKKKAVLIEVYSIHELGICDFHCVIDHCIIKMCDWCYVLTFVNDTVNENSTYTAIE